VKAGSEPPAHVNVAGEPPDKERSRICRKACDYIRRNPERQADDPKLNQIPRPSLVIDTNVVIDWLLFADASSVPLAAAVARRKVRWIATEAMRDELAEVMRRGLAARCGADPAVVLAHWDALAEMVAEPARWRVAPALQCSDTDDQKFLDLARTANAQWLLSRDRALLRLARRAAPLGLTIALPQCWQAPA
jgi:predicted nucleic acid-binding protein